MKCARRLGPVLLSVLLAAAPGWSAAQSLEFRAPPAAGGANTPAVMRDLAVRMLPVYQDPDPDRYLATLANLQIAAGDYPAAEESRRSLRERGRGGQPVGRGAVLDLYARARAIEAQNRTPFAQALARAYQELVARLDDHDAYSVNAWLSAAPRDYEDSFQQLLDRLRPNDTIDEGDAESLLSAYVRFEAQRALAPLVGPLEAADDARRYVEEESTIPVPHWGAVAATVIRPRSASGPLAALLEVTIDAPTSSPKETAAHGYAGVWAHLPRGAARGAFVPYQHDGEVAHAIIGWIVKQPWSDGRVGMYGEGYSGFTAWAAATGRVPPALKAIAVADPTAPGIDAPMSGGIFQNSAYRWSLEVTNTKPALDGIFADDAVWRALNEKWYRSGRRYRDLGRLYGHDDPLFIRWLNHPSYDRFWQTMIPFEHGFARVDIPVLTMTGYFAAAEPAALYYFAEHHRYDAHADHTLLIGPYEDGTVQRGPAAALRGYEVDPAAMIDLRELRYQWLDHEMKGAALPELLSGRVNYEVMGANEWRHAARIEDMAAQSLKFYLSAAAGSSGDGHRLSRRKLRRSAAVTQTVSLTDRSDAGWMPPTDLITKSLVTHNAAMFASAPLKGRVEFSGLLAGTLDFTVNKQDMDINISPYELTADGDYVRLFDPTDELRLSYAADRVHRHLLKAGERQRLRFRGERMTSRLLQAGSRLVIVLRVSKRPDREINYGTGNDVSEESIEDGKVPIRVRWYNDSYIEIPARAAPADWPARAAAASRGSR